MRVLVIASNYKPAFIYGGPVRSVSSMCEAISKLGVDIRVLTTNANGNHLLNVPLEQSIKVDGVEVYYCPIVNVPPKSFFYSPALAKACRQEIQDYDIIVMEAFFTHVMGPAVKTCKQANKPYVISLRGQLLPWSLKQKYLKKKIYFSLFGYNYLNSASAIHCTDVAEVEAAKKLKIKTPTFIVPNGVDFHRFSGFSHSGQIRKRFGISDNAHILLFLGRLHPKKRPDLAIEALSAAQSLSSETHLVFAGPDEMNLASKLYEKALQLGCATKVHFTGILQGDEVLAVLRDANLLIMPSEPESENFGMAAVEAMAAGVPVLISEGVPLGRLVESYGAGRVVPCSADIIKKVTLELLSDSSMLLEMGHRGQSLVRENFDIPKVAQRMLEQYKYITTDKRFLPSC